MQSYYNVAAYSIIVDNVVIYIYTIFLHVIQNILHIKGPHKFS